MVLDFFSLNVGGGLVLWYTKSETRVGGVGGMEGGTSANRVWGVGCRGSVQILGRDGRVREGDVDSRRWCWVFSVVFTEIAG